MPARPRSPTPPGPSRTDGPPEAFLVAVRPKLRRMLRRARIPEQDADDLIQDTLLALVFQWRRVRDPNAWVAGALRKHCLMYWRSHRRRLYDTVDRTGPRVARRRAKARCRSGGTSSGTWRPGWTASPAATGACSACGTRSAATRRRSRIGWGIADRASASSPRGRWPRSGARWPPRAIRRRRRRRASAGRRGPARPPPDGRRGRPPWPRPPAATAWRPDRPPRPGRGCPRRAGPAGR